MEFVNEFTVPTDIETAWATLTDLEKVAPCLPGATLEEVDGDTYSGRVKVKVGPITVTYRGTAKFVETDADKKFGRIEASGKEARGSGTAKADVTAQLTETDEGTLVHVVTDLNVTGKPAQFGRGVMGEVGTKIIGAFAERLEELVLSDDADGDAGTDEGAEAAASSDAEATSSADDADAPGAGSTQKQDLRKLERLITRTLTGLQSTATGGVQASNLKRALLRKDSTFSELDHGFRGFRELLRHLEENGAITLTEGSAPGDPEVDLVAGTKSEDAGFALLRETVKELMDELGGDPPLSGLKDQLRKRQPDFSEKDLGYGGFLQFCKAAVARNFVEMDWEDEDGEYYLYVDDEVSSSRS